MKQHFFYLVIVLVSTGLGCGSSRPAHEGKSLESLLQMLRDPNPEMQIQGAIGLAKMKEQAQSAVPELVRFLDSTTLIVRQYAIDALAEIGPEAKVAVPRLIELLQDREWTIRRMSLVALSRIDDTSAVSAIQKLMKDPDALVRKTATEIWQKMKKKSQ